MAVLQTMTYHIHRIKDIIREDRKGWIICLCVLIITVIRSGITYSFGVFVVELQDTYHRPMMEQDWIGTLSFCISLSCAPMSVAFIRCLHYRGYRWGGIIGSVILSASCMGSSFVRTLEWMFLTHSLLYGVGSSLVYMASSLVIGEYFDKDHRYHVLATSILLCGYPIGSLLFNPFNAWLVTQFGWRVAFRCASILILLSGVSCSWTFSTRDTPNMQRLGEEGEEEEPVEPEPHLTGAAAARQELRKIPMRQCCSLQQIRERPQIVLWYMGNMLSYLGFFMPFVNLASYMKRKHFHALKSSWVLTLLSLSECVTYITSSFLGDYFKGKLIYSNIIAAFALSLICFVWPAIDVNYSLICLIALVMGAFLGLTIVYTYAASGEVTGLPIDIAWSFTNLWSGIGILIGPFFSGAIFDLRQSYDDVFYVIGTLYLIDAIIFLAIPAYERWRAAHPLENYDEIQGGVGQSQTIHCPPKHQRSLSKSSLYNESMDGGGPVEYGTTATTALPGGGDKQPNNMDYRPSGGQEHYGSLRQTQGDYPGHGAAKDALAHPLQAQFASNYNSQYGRLE